MKIMTILGTRPEIIRLSRVIARLDEAPGIEQVIVHTGQNYDYELNELFFEDLEVRSPNHFLNVARSSIGAAYGDILTKSEAVMLEERPDAVLILGDTNSAVSAIIAKRLHIPVFHMEAGNRSFDANVPEEVNRKIVDHVADFNLVYTEHARRNLLAEGLPPRHIYLTGSPMNEVLQHQQPKIQASTATVDVELTPGKFFLVSAHREENVDHPHRLEKLLATLRRLAEEYGWPVLLSLHPRTRNRLGELNDPKSSGLILHRPFGFSDYLRLQLDAACVLSDSGTIAEESSILSFPAVTLRDSIERPEGLETGSIILAGIDADTVLQAVRNRLLSSPTSSPSAYQIGDTSLRVLNLIIGLTSKNEFWRGLHKS